MENLNDFLKETESIDYKNPIIVEQINLLKEKSPSDIDYIKNAYEFVRDEISHSQDVKANLVSKNASEVLINKTGNKTTVNAQFSTEKEIFAFTVRPELAEIDYKDNNQNLDKRLVEILHTVDVIMNIRTDFDLKKNS